MDCRFLIAGCFGLMMLAACGESDSGTNSAYDNDVGQTFSSADGSLTEILLSSSDFPASYSSAGIGLSSEMESVFSSSSHVVPNDNLGSSGMDLPHSSAHFDSAYFGDVVPVSSSGMMRPMSSSRMNPPPFSSFAEPQFSSSREQFPLSSSSEPPCPQYGKILGADISKFQEYESYGTRIFDVDGTEKDIFALLRDHGFNAIRLKTFVSPKAQYGYAAAGCGQDSEAFGDKEHVVAYAQKVKKAGFTFLLDIHYSDVWADPDTQIIPERWRKVSSSDAMADSVYAYTYDLMSALKQVNALPDMVQVGNEITNGMLRDVPTSSTNCWGDNVALASNNVNGVMNTKRNPNGITNTAKYLAAGSRAVKAFETSSHKIKTVFHIESPQNATTVNWWMNSIIKNSKVSPDVMAFSAYTAYQHGTPDSWKTLLTSLASAYPSLEFLIAEYNGGTGKNFYGYDGSRAQTHKIMEQVPRGLGAFFWEPASYGEWGAALLDWDGNNLKANPKAFDEYKVLF